jgi:hypothetical protein
MNNATRPTEQAPKAGLGAVANSDLKTRPKTAAPNATATAAHSSPSSFETVAGDVHTDHVSAGRAARAPERTVDGKKQKVCCHCGKDVAREERFKDKAGYYWCMDCGVQEHHEKHALGHAAATAAGPAAAPAQRGVTCPDCAQPVTADQLVEYEHVKLCNGCAAKRQKKAARDAARQAAIAEEALAEARRRRHVMIAAAVVAGLAVLWAIYAVLT